MRLCLPGNIIHINLIVSHFWLPTLGIIFWKFIFPEAEGGRQKRVYLEGFNHSLSVTVDRTFCSKYQSLQLQLTQRPIHNAQENAEYKLISERRDSWIQQVVPAGLVSIFILPLLSLHCTLFSLSLYWQGNCQQLHSSVCPYLNLWTRK